MAQCYGTAQFKLDKARVSHVLDTTHFSFHTRAGMRVLTRSMTWKLSCRVLVYALDVWQKHACMSGTYTPNLVCVHLGMYTNCKPSIMV